MAEASVFQYSDGFEVTSDVKSAFDTNGYVLIRGLLSKTEVDRLRETLEDEKGVLSQRYERNDGAGRKSKVSLWNQPGNDITGCIAKSHKVAGTFEKLLGGEVYHYHSKVVLKEARTGGAHQWHQDYGYWYENGCMWPDMGTTWIAVDQATPENGCLKILRGSHHMGRLDHEVIGQQLGASSERMRLAQECCELIEVAMEPGDALFFHCNILHRSEQNSSDKRRWAFLVCFNRASNNPKYDHHHPKYTKLEQVPNSAILECKTTLNLDGKDFLGGPKKDFSLSSVTNKAQLVH